MSSLSYSVSSTCNIHRLHSSSPNRNLFRIRTTTRLHNKHSNVQKLNPLVDEKKPKAIGLFGRREAIGYGVSFGVLETLFGLSASAEGNGLCELTLAPSGLAFCDKVVGYGPQAVQGQLIKAHYVGKLENGKVFDSSYNRGKPLTFRVGVGEVIKGWDQGIIGGEGIPPMLAGGKRTLKIPPELGYGVRGAGCRGGSCIIPPNSVLLFDVEFIGKA